MTNSVQSLTQLIQQYNADMNQAKTLVELLLNNKESFLIQGLLQSDNSLRYAVNNGNASLIKKYVENSVHDRAWTAYFNHIQLSDILNQDKYWKAITAYVYENAEKRRFYKGVEQLKDFNLENIAEFQQKFLNLDDAFYTGALKAALYKTGKDWRSYNKEYKPRQTFTMSVTGGLNPRLDSDLIPVLADLFLSINHYQGKAVSQTYLGDMRKSLSNIEGMDTETPVMEGVSLILKPSLSVELRLDKSIVSLLNSRLAQAV